MRSWKIILCVFVIFFTANLLGCRSAGVSVGKMVLRGAGKLVIKWKIEDIILGKISEVATPDVENDDKLARMSDEEINSKVTRTITEKASEAATFKENKVKTELLDEEFSGEKISDKLVRMGETAINSEFTQTVTETVSKAATFAEKKVETELLDEEFSKEKISNKLARIGDAAINSEVTRTVTEKASGAATFVENKVKKKLLDEETDNKRNSDKLIQIHEETNDSNFIKNFSEDKHWIKDLTFGAYVWNPVPQEGESVRWNGRVIREGDNLYAQGIGELTWYKDGQIFQMDEGNFERGKQHGHFKHTRSNGEEFFTDWNHGEALVDKN